MKHDSIIYPLSPKERRNAKITMWLLNIWAGAALLALLCLSCL